MHLTPIQVGPDHLVVNDTEAKREEETESPDELVRPDPIEGLHLEVPGCIVNIRFNLTSSEGQPVTSIEVLADQYAGEAWDVVHADETTSPATNIRVVARKKERIETND